MDKVLIYTDTAAIAEQMALVETAISQYQTLFDIFKNLECTVSLPQLSGLIHSIQRGKGDPARNIKMLVVATMNQQPVISGVSLNKEKLSDLIDVPNIDKIAQAAQNCEYDITGLVSLLQITDGTVGGIDDYSDIVAERNKVYATTQTQIDAYNLVNSTITALNTYLQTSQKHLNVDLPEMWGMTPNNYEKQYSIDIDAIIKVV